MEASSATTIIEALLAFGLIAGVLVAFADTRLYPLALGIVVIAALYTVIGHPAALTALGNLLNTAGRITSGSAPAGSIATVKG